MGPGRAIEGERRASEEADLHIEATEPMQKELAPVGRPEFVRFRTSSG